MSNSGFSRKHFLANVKKTGDLENVGNRIAFSDAKIPADNVGNCKELDSAGDPLDDGFGNSLDKEPSHMKSGILPLLSSAKPRASSKRQNPTIANRKKEVGMHQKDSWRSIPEAIVPAESGDAYMMKLAQEFTILLAKSQGLPFVFSTKTTNTSGDETKELNELLDIKELLMGIFEQVSITASISLENYASARHRFAVFFISPSEKSPSKNKQMILALRKIVEMHLAKIPILETNVLLVLANAQAVIEEHLQKLGVKKL